MRVLSVIHYPVFGGPHNRNAYLAPLLEESGVSITVLLPEEAGNAAGRLAEAGVPVVKMPLHRIRADSDPRAQLPFLRGCRREIRGIRSLIREREIDVVLVNGSVNPQAGIAGRLERCAVVWQLLDTFPPAWLRATSMVAIRGLADALMSNGAATATLHRGAASFGDRLTVFFPPVDVDALTPSPERRAKARSELGVGTGEVVIGSLNNINPMKGHRTFIRAAAKLRETRPSVRFAILGATYPNHAGYAAEIWREAEHLGLRRGRELIVRDPGSRGRELLAGFDVFWLSSEPRSEGTSTAVGEAMALGLPVVATDVGSLRETVRDGLTGFVVPPRDASALARLTERLLDDTALYRRFSRAARERAVGHFAPRVCAAHHLAAFHAARCHRDQRLVSRRRRRSPGFFPASDADDRYEVRPGDDSLDRPQESASS